LAEPGRRIRGPSPLTERHESTAKRVVQASRHFGGIFHRPTSKYISVAESLAGEPIRDIIQMTDAEEARILSIANDENHESHEWALWILRKLDVL
jgi:hypothetical protein